MILSALQKLLNNVEDSGKLIVAKGFKRLPKLQNIAQSGHTGLHLSFDVLILSSWFDDYNSHFVETFSAVVMWLAKHFDRKTHWPLAKSFHAGNYGIFVFSRETLLNFTGLKIRLPLYVEVCKQCHHCFYVWSE